MPVSLIAEKQHPFQYHGLDQVNSRMNNTNLDTVNLVVSGDFGIGEVDTDKLADDMQVLDYTINSGRAYIRPNNLPTVTIYRSGKFSIAGAKSLNDVKNTTQWLVESLKKLNIEIIGSHIHNSISTEFMVLQGDLGGHIELKDAMDILEGQTEYEPEQFPAIIYRPSSADCTVTIFSNGKVSITGVRHHSTGEKIYAQIKSSLAV